MPYEGFDIAYRWVLPWVGLYHGRLFGLVRCPLPNRPVPGRSMSRICRTGALCLSAALTYALFHRVNADIAVTVYETGSSSSGWIVVGRLLPSGTRAAGPSSHCAVFFLLPITLPHLCLSEQLSICANWVDDDGSCSLWPASGSSPYTWPDNWISDHRVDGMGSSDADCCVQALSNKGREKKGVIDFLRDENNRINRQSSSGCQGKKKGIPATPRQHSYGFPFCHTAATGAGLHLSVR